MQVQIVLDFWMKSVRKRKTNTVWYHLHVESKIWHKRTHLQQRFMDIENRFVVEAGGGGKDGVGVWG